MIEHTRSVRKRLQHARHRPVARGGSGFISVTDSIRCVTAVWCRAFWG